MSVHTAPRRPPPAAPPAAFMDSPREPFPANPPARGMSDPPLREGYYGSVLTGDRRSVQVAGPGAYAGVFQSSSALNDSGAMSPGGEGRSQRRHGKGMMVYADRTLYEGDWVDDERHGHGICYFPSGNIYIGSFVHGHMEGQGSMLYHDGDFFTGTFRQSTCHGVGVFYSGGTEVRGEWRNGVRVAVQKRRTAGSTMEDFDAQRLHYETFRAVLGQLHGHFTYYALFDNRFQRTTEGQSGIAEPLRPTHTDAQRLLNDGRDALPPASEEDNLSATPPQSPIQASTATATNERSRGDRTSSKQQRSVPFVALRGGHAARSPPRQQQTEPVFVGRATVDDVVASSDDDGGGDGSSTAAVKRRLSSPPTYGLSNSGGQPLGRRRQRTLSLDLGFNSPSKTSNPGQPREPPPPLFSSAAARAEGAVVSPQQGSQPPTAHTVVPPSSQPPLHAQGPSGEAPVAVSAGNPLQFIGAETLNRKTTTPRVLFASAGPMPNEHFSFSEYTRYALSFLFPLFSIPHLPACPFVMTGLEMEREFVVSGAALSHDFTPPKGAVYISLVGMMVQLLAIIIAGAATGSSAAMGNRVQHAELLCPVIAWATFAFVCAGYHGYFRVAHALERLDRRLAPKLASFAASVVDASADICVFTWDEEGRSKITNPHYKYRWLFYSVVMGAVSALAVPVTRGAFGYQAFLSNDAYESAVVGLTVVAMFLFSSGVCYYLLKITDMQRQVASQLQVLTKLAFLDGVSIAAPSEHRGIKFDFDAPLDLSEFFCGFVGWWISRNFILAASACSNHLARATGVTAVIVSQTVVCFLVIGDAVYAGASGQLNLSGPGSGQVPGEIYFTGAHGLALVWVAIGGSLLIRYLVACVSTQHELRAHLNIMDIAAMYHGASQSDRSAAHVIMSCRSMAAQHDPLPTVASIPITPLGVLFLSSMNVLAFSVLWVVFADAVHKA